MRSILPKKKTVMGISIGLLAVSFYLASQLGMELMASDDQGEIRISVDTRPGLITENVDTVLKEIEAVIAEDPNLDSYMTTYGGGMGSSSATISAYLKDDRDMETADVAELWQQQLAGIKNCDIDVEASSSMSMMSSFGQSYEVILKGADYDEVKEISETIVNELKEREDVTKVHSDLENSAPVVEVQVDALKAQAEGLTAADIGGAVSEMIGGVEATEIDVDGESVTVNVESTRTMSMTRWIRWKMRSFLRRTADRLP